MQFLEHLNDCDFLKEGPVPSTWMSPHFLWHPQSCSKVFSGNQLCQYGLTFQRFRTVSVRASNSYYHSCFTESGSYFFCGQETDKLILSLLAQELILLSTPNKYTIMPHEEDYRGIFITPYLDWSPRNIL
jgi:hypothetical protein